LGRPVAGESRRGLEWHYAWVVVAVTFATILVGAGIRYAPGVLIVPLENEFGWSRASISLAVSIGLFVFGLSGPVGGALMDRYGPRLVMIGGICVTVAGLFPLLLVKELWQFYFFWGLVTGLGTGALSGSVGNIVAARWFKAHRGMVMGVFASATSMGQLIFIPSLLGLSLSSGWRSAVVVLTVIGAFMLFPVILFMRNNPSDKGLRAFGDDGSAVTAAQRLEDTRQTPMRVAIKRREFWLLAGSLFICGYTTTGLMTTHLIPFSLERGFDEVTTAGTMGLMGAMNMAGTLISGWLTDRYDNRKLLALTYFTRALSLIALLFIVSAPQLLIFAVVYGLDWIASGPPSANLVATIFGKASLGTIYGWIFFAHMVGASIAAYAAGLLHGLMGSYNVVFMSAALLLFASSVFALNLRTPARPSPALATEAVR